MPEEYNPLFPDGLPEKIPAGAARELAKELEDLQEKFRYISPSLRTNWGDRSVVFEAILERLMKQRQTHGGPDHDDAHSQNDWISFIVKFAGMAVDTIPGEFRHRMIDVAALAISAWESSQRKS